MSAVKQAIPDHSIHELIARRWSPYAFTDRPVSDDDLRSLFEAARWAASSYNEQPWNYILATKANPAEFERLLSCLVEGNQAWAKNAPVLALGCTSLSFKLNGKPNAAAIHDLGLASATLTLEATARGLFVHQMIGIVPEKAREVFRIPEGIQPLTGLAIGHAADPATVPEKLRERDLAPRTRKPLSEFVFSGAWGTPSSVVAKSGTTVPRADFEKLYASRPPWDIDGPQKPFKEAANRITGSVLDAGCGTGENALFIASQGRKVTGIDFLEKPIQQAKRKAQERGISVAFLLKDALALKDWSERFDNVIDSGLFHVFSDDDRRRYVEGLASVVKPGGRVFLMCFSDEEPGSQGPRRVSKQELQVAFAEGWAIESIDPKRFEVRPDFKEFVFSEGGPRAWFAVVRRVE